MSVQTLSFYGTSVGKKVVMAVTGFIVFGFVTVHMIGNLQIYQGPDKLNAYAAFLQNLGPGLWAFRIVMLSAVLLHILSATLVTLQSFSARPTRYKLHRHRETTYAARTMWWGGPIIGIFIIYHLMHLTTGSAHPDYTGNVYNNVVYGFQVWWVSGLYIVAMIFIGLHLYHGVWSMFQSVGLYHPAYNHWRKILAIGFSLLITFGNISIPVSVLTGMLQPV